MVLITKEKPMNLALPIDSYFHQCGSAPAKGPDKKDEKLHEYVIYDPKGDYRSNRNWGLVWRGIETINKVSLFSLAEWH